LFSIVFFLLIQPPPRSTLFPYTTLFRSSVLRKVDTYLRIGGGILDGVVQKNQKQLMQRGLIADIGNLLVQVAHDGNARARGATRDRKSTRLNSSHVAISYAVFCLKKKKQ